MKKNVLESRGIWMLIVFIIFFLGADPAHANFFGSDNFNDNIVDTSKWGVDFVAGGGVLTETNSRLEYTVASQNAAQTSTVERPWILNHGSYIENWAVQLDVGIGNVSVPSGPGPLNFATMALFIENADDPNGDGALIDLLISDSGRVFIGNFFVNGSFSGSSAVTPTTSEAAAVRIVFDSINKLLFLQYDENGSVGGYNWITQRTVDITPWNMTDTSVFNALILAQSEGVALTSGEVTADNFFASAPIPEPSTMLLIGSGLLGLAGYGRKKLLKK